MGWQPVKLLLVTLFSFNKKSCLVQIINGACEKGLKHVSCLQENVYVCHVKCIQVIKIVSIKKLRDYFLKYVLAYVGNDPVCQ
jgi:hypothetical protein